MGMGLVTACCQFVRNDCRYIATPFIPVFCVAHHPCPGYVVSMRTTLLLSLIIIVLSSCSKDNPAAPVTYVQPKVGSTYYHDYYNTDTTSGMPIASTRDTTIITITEVGTSFMGKSNVAVIQTRDANGTTTNLMNYEANGDVSMLAITEGSSKWLLLPVSSKSAQSVTLMDTTIDLYGVSMRSVATVATTYSGTESMTVKGQALSVVKLSQTFTYNVTANTITTTGSTKNYLYYAPSIGFFAKTEVPIQVSPFDREKQQGQVSTLIDYLLK